METLEKILLELEAIQMRLAIMIAFKLSDDQKTITFFQHNNETNLKFMKKASHLLETVITNLYKEIDKSYKNKSPELKPFNPGLPNQ